MAAILDTAVIDEWRQKLTIVCHWQHMCDHFKTQSNNIFLLVTTRPSLKYLDSENSSMKRSDITDFFPTEPWRVQRCTYPTNVSITQDYQPPTYDGRAFSLHGYPFFAAEYPVPLVLHVVYANKHAARCLKERVPLLLTPPPPHRRPMRLWWRSFLRRFGP